MECSNVSAVAGTMKASVILPCLVVLCQFYSVLCDYPAVDRDCKTNERIKRYHENDCQKRNNFEKKENKTATSIGSKHTEMKARTVPQSVNKAKLPINERNQPKDVRTINHILEEIACLAHNHNETKGIHKIKHLVDEIDNLHKVKTCIESDDVKTSKKESISNVKETNAKQTNKLTQEPKTVVKMEPVKKTTNRVHIENKDSINANKPLLTNGRRCYNEKPTHLADDTIRNKTLNENLIEIEEHKYEEELLRSPYNTYNLNMAQNYNAGPMSNANNIENDSPNLYNYPLTTYEQNNGNNEYYYANSPSLTNQPTFQNNGDFMRCRKTWLDRNTVISPNEEVGRIIREDRKELTNIQNPDYYRKYYSVTQKQYSRNNEGQNNPYWYYLNPYQSRK